MSASTLLALALAYPKALLIILEVSLQAVTPGGRQRSKVTASAGQREPASRQI
eukprot:CAMPEP_0194757320 /NCGR_PEP_ID=MMETSP0323_2-20130528/10841_1 /TAXON_ID=2866 ORGANISM="Crypthecodinium cohnii, Strain Seligo" /NCGR_SAMPLE_ID=MMETSP0323_2 /ASSEMBLY_ACC=CAM_ASM_000346 /LENGTH=52 /DNA_ID=CAMNT_0039677209 /DNA_START=604 /DNA_END=762 /DNA_ORIENTATION=-